MSVESTFESDPSPQVEDPGEIPLVIQTLLLGFQGDGAFQYQLDSSKLENLLLESFSSHETFSIEPSSYNHKSPHEIELAMQNGYHFPHKNDHLHTYHFIQHRVENIQRQLESFEILLKRHLTKIEGTSFENETHTIAIEPLEPFFENLVKQQSTVTQNLQQQQSRQQQKHIYTIIFVNPSKDRLISSLKHEEQLQFKSKEQGGEGKEFKYQYTLNGHVCGPAWIGAGRFIVIDLSAGPLNYGSTLHKSNEELISEGAVDQDSFPRLIEYFQKEGYSGTSLQGASPIEILAHISSLVISSVKHIFLPDSKYDYIPLFQKILIPILTFKDHDKYNTTLDMHIITKEAKRLFPFSDVTIITGTHALHEHKHISMALFKSIQSYSSFEMNPKTLKELLMKLKYEDDILASGLIGDQVTQIPTFLKTPENPIIDGSKNKIPKTKVLPVYIFSIGQHTDDLLLDKYHFYSSNQEAIVVLQTEKPIQAQFYKGNKHVTVDPISTVNRNIIAGLAMSQGLMGPTIRYSDAHKRLTNNYLWTFGQHPFGYFGNNSEISQIFIDSIIRNTIITSVKNSETVLEDALTKILDFSIKYMTDSFGFDVNEIPSGGSLIDRLYHSPPSKSPLVKSTITRLHDELNSINTLQQSLNLLTFSRIDSHLTKQQKDTITQNLSSLSIKVNGFLEYVSNEIAKVETQLLCCKIAYQSPKSNSTTSNLYSFIIVKKTPLRRHYIAAVYLLIRFLETLDTKVEKEYKDVLSTLAKEKSERRIDTSRFNCEKRGRVYIKTPSSSTSDASDWNYCVLKANMLFLFKNQTDSSAIGIICFDGCSISIIRNKIGSSKYHKKNCIAVIHPERELMFHSRILHFYYDNGKELETWFWFLKEASSLTIKKTPQEELEAKTCQKFFAELPNRLQIAQSQQVTSALIHNSTPDSASILNGHRRTPSNSSSSTSPASSILNQSPKSPLATDETSFTSPGGNNNSFLRNRSSSNSSNNNSGYLNGVSNVHIDNQIDSIINDYSSNISTTGSSTTTSSGTASKRSSKDNYINNTSITNQPRFDWVNALLGRVFFNLYDSEALLGFAASKITKKINKLKKPSILKSITLQNLEFGPNLPVLKDAQLLYISSQGELSADLQIEYHGGFTLTIKIEVMISFRQHSVTIPFVISVLVKSLSGRANIQCLPPPTKRFWFGFYEEPQCEIVIDTSIGQSKTGYFTNMPKLAKIIVNKLKAELFEMIVLPNMDDFPMPTPKTKKKNDSIVPPATI
eukprot:gene2318-2858_t